jgi:hypothetical protein
MNHSFTLFILICVQKDTYLRCKNSPGIHADLHHELDLASVEIGDGRLEQAQVGTEAYFVERAIKGSRVEQGDACSNKDSKVVNRASRLRQVEALDLPLLATCSMTAFAVSGVTSFALE